jgi:hypothetical protein
VSLIVEAPFLKKARAPAKHPEAPELVGGEALRASQLKARPDASQIASFIELIANAEYWLSFELSSFEPLLARSPSPFRELGVGIALRFGEGVDGSVLARDVAAAKEALVPSLPEPLRSGVSTGLETLERAIAARDGIAALERQGFEPYAPSTALSVHALMAMGKARIEVQGAESLAAPEAESAPATEAGRRRSAGFAPAASGLQARIGTVLELRAEDDKKKPLEPPEIETELGAPVFAKRSGDTRSAVFVVPGKYRLRVPGRAEGSRWLLVR